MGRIGKCTDCKQEIRKGQQYWRLTGGTGFHHFACRTPPDNMLWIDYTEKGE
jgi:hypothetical protein